MRTSYYPYYYHYTPYRRYYDYHYPYFYNYYWPYKPYHDDSYYLYDSNFSNVEQAITNFGDMTDVYQNSYVNQIG